jgi:hypothetical protein
MAAVKNDSRKSNLEVCMNDEKEKIVEGQAVDMILAEYSRITCFLEKTMFKARPLRITVDGPYSIGASFEVSLSKAALTSPDA